MSCERRVTRSRYLSRAELKPSEIPARDETACVGAGHTHNAGVSARPQVFVCLLVLLLAGCATNPRHTGARLPDWENGDAASAPAAPPSILAPIPAPAQTPGQINEPASQTTAAWIPLVRWCKAHGLGAPSRLAAAPAPTYGVNLPGGGLVLHAGSRLAYLGGVQLWLGFGPQVIGGQPCVHALDLRKTLEPLLAGKATTFFNGQPTIVIDPGHGGEDAGTRSVLGDHCEKEFTLDWARRLELLLAAQGWRVLLTRRQDTNLALSNRLAFADAHKADLFLSLHFNSSAPDHEQAGLETYCLTPAGQPSSVTRGFSDDSALTFPNNAFDARNLQFAFQVQRSLLQVKGSQDRGVRRARYLGVLRGQTRPAILVEGGYLSNPREARLIADPEHRQKLAEALAKAVLDISEVRTQKAEARSPAPPVPSQTNSSL